MKRTGKAVYPASSVQLTALKEELLAQKSAIEGKIQEIDTALDATVSAKSNGSGKLTIADYQSDEFAQGLQKHFHQAKRKALKKEAPGE